MVKWTEKAKDDLYRIHEFISRENPDAANKVIEGIFNAEALLDENPLLGRVVPELKISDSIREIIHSKEYRIMYIIADEESIEILQVRHTSQQL